MSIRLRVRKIHAGEVDTDVSLVRRLLAGQFPQWAALSIVPVDSIGTVNAMYRLGSDKVVRLPRVDWALGGFQRELEWLPWLAQRLAVPIPTVLATGVPAEGYPFPWSVLTWLPGQIPEVGGLADPFGLADDLASFIGALHRLETSGAPLSNQSLAIHDEAVRRDIAALAGRIDERAVTAVWDAAVRVPEWQGEPVWLHGDLLPGNILIARGRLCAVIDFSATGVGDPAGDLRVAWNLLPGSVRSAFRRHFEVDEATWLRARGKALAQSLNQLRYYRESSPILARNGLRVIGEIVSEGVGVA